MPGSSMNAGRERSPPARQQERLRGYPDILLATIAFATSIAWFNRDLGLPLLILILCPVIVTGVMLILALARGKGRPAP